MEMRGLIVLLFSLVTAPADTLQCVCNCNCSLIATGLVVDCSNRNMTALPRFPDNTTSLNLTGNNLHVLPAGRLSNLNNLTVLDISDASLSQIDDGAFSGLTKLNLLNISKNENLPLTSRERAMNASAFKDLESLKELIMYGTTTANLQPDTYPIEALGYLSNLETLWLDGMANKSFGSDLVKLEKLQTLRFPGDLVGFGFCNMYKIQGTFDYVTSLTRLYVRKCGLHCIDKDAFRHLYHLKYLDLSFNIFLKLDGNAGCSLENSLASLHYTNISVLVLNNIRTPFLQDCGMNIRSTDFSGLKNTRLEKLYLEHNGITKIKGKGELFENLPETLKVVSLRDNTLEFDYYLFFVYRLKSLTHLDISYQFFQELWGSGQTKTSGLRKSRSSIRDVKINRLTSYSTEDESTRAVQYMTVENSISTHKICKTPNMRLPYVIPFLPDKLEFLDSSHSKMNHPLYNVTVKDNYSLKRINASYSMLFCWRGPIYGLHALEYLDLSHNLCSRVSTVFFDEFRNLTELNVANNMLSEDIKNDVAGLIMKNLTRLRKLDLSNNRLQTVPANFLLAQSQLQILDLSYNLLTSFDIKMEHMDKLEYVDLTGNGISTLAEEQRMTFERIAKKTSLKLNLTENFLHCYCNHIDTLKWVRKTESMSLRVKIERCFDENETEIPLRTFKDLDNIISKLERECVTYYVVIIAVTIGTVIITDIIVGILVYRYRWKLRYWYYISRHNYRQRRGKYQQLSDHAHDSDMKHDVYVVCSEEDAKGEFVNDMFRYLQNENGLNLIEQERHFFGNGSLAQMMWAAIHESRVSVFVMTKSWVQEGTWEYQLRICREESLKRGRRVYFSVFPEGLPEDIPGNKKWRELSDIANAVENLEYPVSSSASSNMDEIQTFWKQCLLKISEKMRSE